MDKLLDGRATVAAKFLLMMALRSDARVDMVCFLNLNKEMCSLGFVVPVGFH